MGVTGASAAQAVLCFSDLTSGPRTGNSDTSLGQRASEDGAIITIWGKNLGIAQADSKIFANGVEARVYFWGNATAPADLFARHHMQMISFQISHLAQDGPGEICVVVNGHKSNPLPFTVRAGRIYFVQTTGTNSASGDWTHPWQTIPHAARKLAPGDIAYICDGVNQVVADGYNAAVNLDSDGEPGKPKALVAYPGARCLVGANNIERGFGHWVAGKGHTADHWTLSKFTVTAHISPVLLGSGYRVVGNYVTAPTGSAPEGAIEGSGNDLFVLGNEITKVGRPGCSKLYHPIYISSAWASSGARRPPEANREVAWNYLHDNSAIRGINIYSERASTAYMSGHRVHDNFIVDQVSDGMLLGQYTTGENWVYNNVIVRAGLGPEPDPRESEASSHFGVSIDAGHETVTNTVIHFYHNTIYSCGWSGARRGANGAVHLVHLNRYTLHFGNNLIVSTGEPYLSGWSDKLIPPTRARNLWFGAGAPPAWDLAAIGAEPRFVDAAHDDFRLQPNSPAIDTGADVAVRTDFNGVSRPQGTSPDLGAYELEKEQPKAVPAKGPLRVHPTNPRYFTDGSGKAILLTGSHTWGNLQDYRYATLPSPPPMDFPAYLAFMQRHHHNFFRLWAWETSFNPNAKQSTISYDPMLYQRPGSGSALDGKPKFDLSLFNPAYFDRLRARVMAARDRGIYVSVMLFNGFSIEGKGNVGGDPWQGHPFNPKNNINAVDGGGSRTIHTLANPEITAQQEAYVRKVIDTVNDLDNVLYEITNEDSGSPAGVAWQINMIRFIKQYEVTKPKQHPVGMTACWPEGSDATLLASPADWISPTAKLPLSDGRKVILNDTDHSYFWTGLKADGLAAQRAWVWKNFTRGNQCLFMDPYLDPSHDPGRNNPVGGQPDSYWDTLREAMGQTRMCAERMNLAAMVPHGELASTEFCLADPGKEYLVYLPQGGEVTVDLSGAAGKMNVEWLRPAEGNATRAESMTSGGKQRLRAPFNGEAVLYLWSN